MIAVAAIQKKIAKQKQKQSNVLARLQAQVQKKANNGKIDATAATQISSLLDDLIAQSAVVPLDPALIGQLQTQINATTITQSLKNGLLAKVNQLLGLIQYIYMDFVRRYRAYLRDNPEGYWFKDKPYGWGWVPATWQGWTVFGLYLIVFTGLLVTFTEMQVPSDDDTTRFLLEVFAWAASLVYVCYATGEPPKWMWGFPKKKK